MKILFIGDPHIKITRLDLGKQFLEWVTKEIIRVKPDLVVNLGDLFDTHAVVRSEVMGLFRQHVDAVLSNGVKYIYVLGNHDMYKPNDASFHALQPFKNIHENFTVVDEIMDIDGITYVPYQHNFHTFPKSTKSICVAHQTFIGADYGYNRPDVGVTADSVSADIIISGHIHLRQSFGKVIYPGSPFSQSKNDINQIKGVLLFDTENFNQQFIPCALPMWHHRELNLSDLSTDKILSLIEEMNYQDNWLIDIIGEKASIAALVETAEFKTAKHNKKISIKPIVTDKDKKLKTIKNNKNVSGVVSEYIETIYQGNADKDKLTKLNNSILSKINVN